MEFSKEQIAYASFIGIGIFTMLFLFSFVAGTWYDSDWQYKKQLNISNANIDEDLINYPLLVVLNSTNFNFSHADSEGIDIRFVNASETGTLSFDVEYYNSTSEEAYIWVKIPNVSSSDTTSFYLYYGNPSATSGENKFDVWTNNYSLVLHLNETSGDYLDLSQESNNGSTGADLLRGQKGISGFGANWSRLESNVSIPHSISQGTLNLTINFTMELWVYTEEVSNAGPRLMGKEDSTSGLNVLVQSQSANKYQAPGNSITAESTSIIDLDSWQYVSYGKNDSGVVFMINNSLEYSADSGALPGDSVDDFYIGHGRWLQTRTFNGSIDEVRYSSVSRSKSWLLTNYLSQSNQLLTFSGELQDEGLSFSIVAPDNSSNFFTGNNVTFNISITPTNSNLRNSTLWLYFRNGTHISNETKSLSGNTSTSVLFHKNLTNENYKWSVEVCSQGNLSEAHTCSFSAQNRTLNLTLTPWVVVNRPTATETSLTIPINFTLNNNSVMDTCFYNITLNTNPNNVQISNTNIANCRNTTTTLSSEGTYSLNYWFNHTYFGESNYTQFNFTIDTSGGDVGGGSGGGGGGGSRQDDEEEEPPKENICLEKLPELENAWDVWVRDPTIETFRSFWFKFWNYVFCRSSASLIPV